jgi:hypothetical protein
VADRRDDVPSSRLAIALDGSRATARLDRRRQPFVKPARNRRPRLDGPNPVVGRQRSPQALLGLALRLAVHRVATAVRSDIAALPQDAVGVLADGADHDPPRQRIRLDNRASAARLREYVAASRPALVVLDPLNRLHGVDENRPSQMTPVMDALAAIAYDVGCAVLCIHHLAKPSAERRGDIWDRFRGASSIRSGTDANLVLDGTGDRVRLVGEFRDAESLSEWVELDREALLFRSADAPAVSMKVDPIAFRPFVEARGQVTGRQVCDEFKVAKHTALAALRGLGCDEYVGPRGTLVFTMGTVQ